LHITLCHPPDAPASAQPYLAQPAPTAIDTLSLHDALPISPPVATSSRRPHAHSTSRTEFTTSRSAAPDQHPTAKSSSSNCRQRRSEEHTSELQSREKPVCRLPLEKTKPTPRS